MIAARMNRQRRARACLGAAALCTLLLLGTPWQRCGGQVQPPTAILMVARAEVTDPNFADAAVLVMNNLGPGPVGIILNRPTPVPLARLFPDLKGLARVQDKV